MRDSEDGHLLWESWISPGKRKRKKNSEKDKIRVQQKNSKTEESEQNKKDKKDGKTKKKKKKKKKPGIKAEEGERKKQRKDKKGQKKAASLGCDDSVLFALTCPQPEDVAEDARKRTKRKKKVAFCLSPGAIAVKRPKHDSSLPKDSVVLQGEDADSQGASDDVNSQDLFITQKTFRPSPVDSSSGEVCDEALTQPERTPRPSRPRPEPPGAAGPRHVRSWGQNPFLDDPVEQRPETLSSLRQQPPSCPRQTLDPSPPQISSSSTQTENFFTPEFSSFLNFRQKRPAAVCFEEPLDLSLPQRAGTGRSLSGSRVKDKDKKMSPPPEKMSCSGLAPLRSSAGEHGRRLRTSPSPQSDPDPKTVDATTSSEDNETTCCPGKLDMTQVRAVQMRLNESFFFKTKGEDSVHRPESPLMKLAQGREMKSRKGH